MEGTIPFQIPGSGEIASTWYKIVGDISNCSTTPLLTLHGGPAVGHDYLTSLTDLYHTHGIPIIFYDQIGCGKSTHFPDKMGDETFWTEDLFMQELDNLIDALELRDRGFHILGQSWGGMFGGAYAAKRPQGLKKLVLASAPASMPLFAESVAKLLEQLPQDVQDTIRECERKGDFESEEYKNAVDVFYGKFICRLDPWPQPVVDTFKNIEDDPTVYVTMLGPSEFTVVGSLKDWDRRSEAHRINVPTLITNGRYDEVQDFVTLAWFQHIKKVKWVTFAESSHMPHWEERERYMEVVGNFLTAE